MNPLIIPAFAHSGDATGLYAAALVDIIVRAAGTAGLMSLHESDAYGVITEATKKVAEVLCGAQEFETHAERIEFLVKTHIESTSCPGGLIVNLVCSLDLEALKTQYKEEAKKRTANLLFVHIIKVKYYKHLQHEHEPRRGKGYQLNRNGFKGRTYVGSYNFEEQEAREIIIRYELPLRKLHHSACMKFGELHAQRRDILPWWAPGSRDLTPPWHGTAKLFLKFGGYFARQRGVAMMDTINIVHPGYWVYSMPHSGFLARIDGGWGAKHRAGGAVPSGLAVPRGPKRGMNGQRTLAQIICTGCEQTKTIQGSPYVQGSSRCRVVSVVRIEGSESE